MKKPSKLCLGCALLEICRNPPSPWAGARSTWVLVALTLVQPARPVSGGEASQWWRIRSCRRMFEFLLRPIFSSRTSSISSSSSSSSSSSKVISHSTPSSSSSLISSSHREVRPIHTVIIQRNLITDFLEATSLPVNVPIHRSREASW